MTSSRRWDTELDVTAGFNGRAVATADLRDRQHASAVILSRTQAELDSTRTELDAERRGRDVAENELTTLRGQVTIIGRGTFLHR